LLRDESVCRGRSKKLAAAHVGLYEIIGFEEPNLLLRTKQSKVLQVHTNQAKLFFAWLQMWMIFACSLLCVMIMGQGIDFRIEPVQSSPALYYQCEGTARLYATWVESSHLSQSARS